MTKNLFWAILLLWVGHSMPAVADACTDQCWLDYDNCYCGDYWSCAACDEGRDNCLNYCATNPPPPCPSTRDYTISTIVNASTIFYNYGCYWSFTYYPKQAVTFDQWRYRYRFDNYRETTSCNGSKTTQLLSSNYSSYTSCLREGGIPCNHPSNLPFSPPLCPF